MRTEEIVMDKYSPLLLINMIIMYLHSYSPLEFTEISHLIFPKSKMVLGNNCKDSIVRKRKLRCSVAQ